jgi:hypothetical protein
MIKLKALGNRTVNQSIDKAVRGNPSSVADCKLAISAIQGPFPFPAFTRIANLKFGEKPS